MNKSDKGWLAVLILGTTGIGVTAAVASKRTGEPQTAALEDGDGSIPADAVTYEGERFGKYDQADITHSAYSQLSDRVSWRDLSA